MITDFFIDAEKMTPRRVLGAFGAALLTASVPLGALLTVSHQSPQDNLANCISGQFNANGVRVVSINESSLAGIVVGDLGAGRNLVVDFRRPGTAYLQLASAESRDRINVATAGNTYERAQQVADGINGVCLSKLPRAQR